MKYIVTSLLVLSLLGLMVSNAFALDMVPSWIKQTSGWWADDQIDDFTFAQAIGFLIKNKIIQIQDLPTTIDGETIIEDDIVIPSWIKNNASWWAAGQISDSDFLYGIKFLVETNTIKFQSAKYCNSEVDKNGDNIPDSFDVNGYVDWSYCDLSSIDFSNGYTFDWKQADGEWSEYGVPQEANHYTLGVCKDTCPADSYIIDLSNSNLTGINLKNANLPNAFLFNSTLNFANLEGANLEGSDMYLTDLANANLKYANLSHVQLYKSDVTNADFRYSNLTSANLCGADSFAFNSFFDFTGANLSYADLDHSKLDHAVLTDAIITHTNFRNAIMDYVDISGMDITGTILSGAELTHANLSNVDLIDLDLAGMIFTGTNLADVVLTNMDLTDASFIDVDLTKIKNKSLAGSDLTNTSFAHSNLSGINLDGVILADNNFWDANLSGVDFTAADYIDDGSIFIAANLSNSNFEGVDLSPKSLYTTVFPNKAYLMRDVTQSAEAELALKKNLFDNAPVLIQSAKVLGDDLTVNYFYFNDFSGADLTNANFSGADLTNVNFSGADLTNVNFSGADLSMTFLDGANLKCINHPICNG